MEEMGITITEEQLTDIVGEDCVYGPDFAECSLGATIEWISEELGLTQDQKNCLQNNALIVPQITDYLLNNNSESIATFLNNYSAEDNPCPTINALSNFLALKQQNDNYKVDRFIELYTLLEEDPEALVENCITEEDLSFWVDLLTFQIPQVCEDKIDALGNGWANQPLEDGDGTTVNLDYYSITIDQLPTRPNGSSFEEIDEFFQYFRLNFYDFIDQNISHFQFFPEPFNDEDLWSSTSPLTSIFTIDISAGPASDDGAVICSSIDGCCWVFSTIKTPQWGLNGNNDGFHPVSGNRQFGYITNGDTYTIYTKGADRANKHDWLNLFSFIFDEEQEIYNGGHNCWVSLMESIENYTQSNGGVVASVYNNDGNLKPKWEIIKNLLQGIEPITVIPCN